MVAAVVGGSYNPRTIALGPARIPDAVHRVLSSYPKNVNGLQDFRPALRSGADTQHGAASIPSAFIMLRRDAFGMRATTLPQFSSA